MNDANRLGLYDYLSELETEWSRYSKDVCLYPSCVGSAIIGEIHTVRKQICTFEMNEAEQVAIEGQQQLNYELEKAIEMKVSA